MKMDLLENRLRDRIEIVLNHLRPSWDKGEIKTESTNLQQISVSGWQCFGSEGLRSGEYLLMWLSCPVTGRTTQSASDGPAQASITRTCRCFWGGGVSQAKSDQQMQFPCATAIWDEDDIMWKWAKWERQHRKKWRRTERERKGDRVRPEGGTSSKSWLLKGKVSICWKARR